MARTAKTKKKSKKGKELEKECPTCGEETVVRDYRRSIEICGNCGRIVKEEIKDRGPEWRAFDQKQREVRSRGGPPLTQTIHDKGLSTQIDWKNRDAKGNKLSPERRQEVYRLRKWNRRGRISDSKDRNLTFSLSEINRMSSQLGLPKSVQETASKTYRKAVEEDLIRGRSKEGCVSAILYAACREAEIPRTLEEIAEASRVDRGKISRTYRFLSRELDINPPPTDPARYVARFGSELNISAEARVEAIRIIRKAQEEKLTSGKSPSGTAAAAIYIALLENGERRTQGGVAEVADVTEVTIRNRYKEIAEELDEEIKIN